MYIELKANEQALLDLLLTVPPSFDAAEEYIYSSGLLPDEITRVGIQYSDECFCEAGWFAEEHGLPHTSEIIPNLHSSYIYDVVDFLIKHKLKPNAIYDDCNIMGNMIYVDNGFLAADTIALLLKHGGNYNLVIDEEIFFECVDFDVFFDAVDQCYRHRFASLVHIWMVMIGYGARCSRDKIKVFKEYDSSEYFDLKKLKNHRNYYFGITHIENDYAISLYDKDTLWEVARII